MATTLLASDTTAAQSSTFTLGDGETATLILTGNGTVAVEIAAASGYVIAGSLDLQYRVKNISGPGTYRINRTVNPAAVGVDKE